MPASLRWESVGTVVLGLLCLLLLLRWVVQRTKRRMLMFLLVAGLFGGLASHTVLRLERYCVYPQPQVHVDCVPDQYDGEVWAIARPVRRLYRAVRGLVIH